MDRKNKEELDKMHWRERYAYEARGSAEALGRLTEGELLKRIQRRQLDPYFAIWRTIAKKGTVEKAGMVLWRFLQENPGRPNMLHRYHCAAALFRLLELDDPASMNPLRKQVQWDHHGEEARQEALLELKELIAAKLAS